MFNKCIARVLKNGSDTVVGAAFLITEKHLLTCAHVVNYVFEFEADDTDKPGGEFFIDFPGIYGSGKVKAAVLDNYWYPRKSDGDPLSDIAVLKVKDPLPKGCNPGMLDQRSFTDVKNKKFVALGFPKNAGIEGRWAEGTIIRSLPNKLVQVKIGQGGYAIQPGFSGGPVCRDDVEGIIGMTTAYDKPEDIRTGFFIPTPLFIEAWPELDQLGKFILSEIEELENGYLHWLVKECLRVSCSPFSAGGDRNNVPFVTLDTVYTALLTNTPRATKSDHCYSDDLAEKEPPLSALELLNCESNLVILGSPGSGKSTFVNYVVLCLAGEALKLPSINLNTLTAPLPNEEDEDTEQRQPWVHGALLPIKVVLRDFAASEFLPLSDQEATAEYLLSFIDSELNRAAKTDYSAHLHKRLNQQDGKVLLLLDGLDEVSEVAQRRGQVCKSIQAFVNAYRDCRVLVTCRPYAYTQPECQLDGFAVGSLAAFSVQQIRCFIDRWYAKDNLDNVDTKGRATLLKDLIFRLQSERLMELACRPLLLTMMVHLHADENWGQQEQRHKLYEKMIELLLKTWEQRYYCRDQRGNLVQNQLSLAEYLRVGPKKIRVVLEELAYKVHALQPKSETIADISNADLVNALMSSAQDKDIKPARLTDHLCDRIGILLAKAEGIYTFPHRSFQEYLAACYLNRDTAKLGNDDTDFFDFVAELGRSKPDRWREVVLLAGLSAAWNNSGPAWQLAGRLCPSPPIEQQVPGSADAWGARLAGQLIVEATQYPHKARSKSNIRKNVCDWQLCLMEQSNLPAPERCAAGDNLAKLGDPRFDVEYWYLPKDPLLGFRCVTEGEFTMGSDTQRDDRAQKREFPQHTLCLPTYYISRFPVIVAQFRSFVEDSGYKDYAPNALQGLDNHPVVDVSWFDAIAYCRWLQVHLVLIVEQYLSVNLAQDVLAFWQGLFDSTLHVGLASEAEWEKAVRGSDGRIYSWGDEGESDKANYNQTDWNKTSAVGCFPGGVSPYGCEDMSGNVWEWTRSNKGDYPYHALSAERAKRGELKSQDARRVVRGGAFSGLDDLARVAFRGSDYAPDNRNNALGFRVVLSPFALDAESTNR